MTAKWNPSISTAPESYPHLENAKIKGHCDTRFEPVWQALEMSFAMGEDVGASVAVFIDGEAVVDIWGGYFDADFDRPWDRDTIITTHSTTKTMTAMAALVLADSGELDLDAPVARYWPEFAAEGKADIPVRWLLGHTSGLAGWTEDVSWADVYDLEKSTALLAAQAPWWKPGTASGYHGITQGHLISGVIERITGKTLGRYFADHVAGPLGADYHIGIDASEDHRIASFVQATPKQLPAGNPIAERVGLNPVLNPKLSTTSDWRRAEIGAANGQGNARSVATVHSALACGGANGVTLLSDAGRLRALEVQADGIDLLLGLPVKWGMGFALESPLRQNRPGHRVAYWGGQGGSSCLVDFDERMSVAFVMNRFVEGPGESVRGSRIIEAAYQSLGR